ncbi:putative short-chain dehydrogenase/reductase [Thozetella sp. PMI_491]|nr:putative short-chain dehydrogenase/reductase [Thozetella sp. PMI_491]
MAAKSVVITGCSEGGLGGGLAAEFQKRNYTVFATARNTKKISASLIELPNVHVVQLDVTSPESIQEAVKFIQGTLGEKGLDVLVNNSGLGTTAPVFDIDIDEAKALFEVNFWGVLRTTQAFQHLLVRGQGTILNVSSIAGEAPDPFTSIYCASKAALTIASETWRMELRALDVKVITLIVGVVKSKWFEKMEPLTLSEGSYFMPIYKIINDKKQGANNVEGTETDEFARRVVNDVIAGKTGLLWRGKLSSTIWVLTRLMPFLVDYLMGTRGGGQKELAEARKHL